MSGGDQPCPKEVLVPDPTEEPAEPTTYAPLPPEPDHTQDEELDDGGDAA